jgi:hypothetical protein
LLPLLHNGTCLSFSPIGSGLQAMKAAGIRWGSWLSAWDCCIVNSKLFLEVQANGTNYKLTWSKPHNRLVLRSKSNFKQILST